MVTCLKSKYIRTKLSNQYCSFAMFPPNFYDETVLYNLSSLYNSTTTIYKFSFPFIWNLIFVISSFISICFGFYLGTAYNRFFVFIPTQLSTVLNNTASHVNQAQTENVLQLVQYIL